MLRQSEETLARLLVEIRKHAPGGARRGEKVNIPKK
jgi:hypothetical protein